MSGKENLYLSTLTNTDWTKAAGGFLKGCGKGVRETYYAIRSRTFPFTSILFSCSLVAIIFASKLDVPIFKFLQIYAINPRGTFLYWPVVGSLVISPFIFWLGVRLNLARKLETQLKTALFQSGLKTQLGKIPALLADTPLDHLSRKMLLTSAGIPLHDFKNAKVNLETSLQIYIDEILEDRSKGQITVFYGHKPLSTNIPFKGVEGLPQGHFVIGYTRAREIRTNLTDTPHLLVAGASRNGKSTFLRQFITTLYLNTPGARFSFIDLKEGLEGNIFQGYPRIEVKDTVSGAMDILERVSSELKLRMKILKNNNCKDVEAFSKLPKEKRKLEDLNGIDQNLSPHLVIIDEAAEIFLAGKKRASPKESQTSMKIISQIARQGRAAGVHLVITTQRPDAKALDTQVKSNLSGTICFRMNDHHSSMVVLGNGRAQDLPGIKGRAIFSDGNEFVEIQTPFLDAPDAQRLLSPPSKQSENHSSIESPSIQTVVIVQTPENEI